jgi:hypothetical protein
VIRSVEHVDAYYERESARPPIARSPEKVVFLIGETSANAGETVKKFCILQKLKRGSSLLLGLK